MCLETTSRYSKIPNALFRVSILGLLSRCGPATGDRIRKVYLECRNVVLYPKSHVANLKE